jgi:hypothetical protein
VAGYQAAREQRFAAREAALEQRSRLLRSHISARAGDVRDWPVGRVCPLNLVAEAWLVHRYGAAMVIERGTRAAGPCSAGLRRRLSRAVEIYEAFSAQRPPGWPAGGPAALCALASQHRAASLAGDVARLLVLAKGMRAAARLRDPVRTPRAVKRALARGAVADTRLLYRRAASAQETAEQRRQRVRDAVLLSGGDPAAWPNAELALEQLQQARASEPQVVGPNPCVELDGVGARAQRYRHELEAGRWTLADGWTDPSPKSPPARRTAGNDSTT